MMAEGTWFQPRLSDGTPAPNLRPAPRRARTIPIQHEPEPDRPGRLRAALRLASFRGRRT